MLNITLRAEIAQVQVKRRETERQAEMRLNSYAYLAEVEQEEAWVDLDAHGPGSALADGVWATLHSAPDSAVPMTLGRDAYLAELLPGARPGRCRSCATNCDLSLMHILPLIDRR
jgi:hypothetical protein